MTNYSISIPDKSDAVLIFQILEVFRQKKMLEFKEVNLDEAEKGIPVKTDAEITALLEKADKEDGIPYEEFRMKYQL